VTRVETTYEALREAIVLGRYGPETRLKAEHIKTDYGVSASTVREALNRLIADGLVIAHGRRGFSVAAFSAADLEDITNVRLLIEVVALGQSFAHGDDRWEMNLAGAYHHLAKQELSASINDEESLRALEAANQTFHAQLVAACPSPILIGMCRQLFTRHLRYRRVALRDETILKKARRDHKALFNAAVARDADAAATVIRRHIESTQHISEALITAFQGSASHASAR